MAKLLVWFDPMLSTAKWGTCVGGCKLSLPLVKGGEYKDEAQRKVPSYGHFNLIRFIGNVLEELVNLPLLRQNCQAPKIRFWALSGTAGQTTMFPSSQFRKVNNQERAAILHYFTDRSFKINCFGVWPAKVLMQGLSWRKVKWDGEMKQSLMTPCLCPRD